MMVRAKRGLAFPIPAIMAVYQRLVKLSTMDDKFYMAQELLTILYELSKFDDARELASSSYVIDIRLGMVARRLVDTTDSISEICWTCGFNNLSNFNRLFLKHKGCSPTEFREKYCKTKNIV